METRPSARTAESMDAVCGKRSSRKYLAEAIGTPCCATSPPRPAPSGSRTAWNSADTDPSVTRM